MNIVLILETADGQLIGNSTLLVEAICPWKKNVNLFKYSFCRSSYLLVYACVAQ